jgi:hypothetical protein
MEVGHGVGHGVSGLVVVEAAEDLVVDEERTEPGRVRPGPGGGEADEIGVEDVAAQCVDGGLAEDDLPRAGCGDSEGAQVLPGALRVPWAGFSVPDLGADGKTSSSGNIRKTALASGRRRWRRRRGTARRRGGAAFVDG